MMESLEKMDFEKPILNFSDKNWTKLYQSVLERAFEFEFSFEFLIHFNVGFSMFIVVFILLYCFWII
jgi:hypothetical protein